MATDGTLYCSNRGSYTAVGLTMNVNTQASKMLTGYPHPIFIMHECTKLLLYPTLQHCWHTSDQLGKFL